MASKDACAAEGTPSLLLRTLDVVSLCVEKPLKLSLGPRAFRLPFTAKMVPSIVYQERNSRAVQGEFGAGGHGLADRVGMIPVNESPPRESDGCKKCGRNAIWAQDVSAWRVNSWVGDFAPSSRLPARDSNFRPVC